ncbi:hypothetical protein GCM10009872_12270 [Actinopolymorpha rutila]
MSPDPEPQDEQQVPEVEPPRGPDREWALREPDRADALPPPGTAGIDVIDLAPPEGSDKLENDEPPPVPE